MKPEWREPDFRVQEGNHQLCFFFEEMTVLKTHEGKIESHGKIHFVDRRMYMQLLSESRVVPHHDAIMFHYSRYLSNLILGE